MLSWFLISLAIVYTHQTSDLNCLQANPGVLDGYFNIFYNKHENIFSVTKEDIAKLIYLFTTRFHRAHIFVGMYPFHMKNLIADGVSLYEQKSNKSAQVFLTSLPGRDLNETVSIWNQTLTAVTDIQKSREGIVGGLYLSTLIQSDLYEEAFEAAFGSQPNPQVPLGFFNTDCFAGFENSSMLGAMQRSQFVTCYMPPEPKPSPEESADEVVKTCDSLRDTAQSKNVSAEIICAVHYYSEGVSPNGVVGSVSDFRRFWCQIIREVTGNTSHPRIMMWSAFDFSPVPFNPFEVHEVRYHTGWWRRAVSSNSIVQSNDPSSFVEKVEEFLNLSFSSGCDQKPHLLQLAFSFAMVSFVSLTLC